MKPKSAFRLVRTGSRLFAIAIVSLLAAQTTRATDLYWDTNDTLANAGATSGIWGTSAFWYTDSTGGGSGGGISATTANDNLFFSAGINTLLSNITLTGTLLANKITFDDPLATATNITLSGATSLTLGGGSGTDAGIYVSSSASGGTVNRLQISQALTLASDVTFQNASSSIALWLSGGVGTAAKNVTLQNNSHLWAGIRVDGGLNNAGTVTNSGTGSGDVEITSVIGPNVLGVIQDSLTSVMTINATNTYTSQTTLKAGVLRIVGGTLGPTGTGALGSGGTVMFDGGILQVGGSGAISDPSIRFNVTAGKDYKIDLPTQGNGTARDMTLGTALAVNGGTGNTNGLHKYGVSKLTLSAAEVYKGITTIGGIDSAGNQTFKGGTLQIGTGASGTGSLDAASSLTFAGTGTFIVNEANNLSQNLSTLTFSAGDGTVLTTNNGGNSFLTFASLGLRGTGGTGNLTSSGGTYGTDNKIILTTTTNAPLNNSGSDNPGLFFGGTGYARYDTTAGYFRAVTYGTDTNALAAIASAETLGIDNATKDVSISGAITAQTSASVNTLNIPGASNFGLYPGATLSLDGILKSGANASFISGGAGLRPIASGDELVIRTNVSGDVLTVATPILANGTNALTKSGAGTLRMLGANTYTGNTAINDGTLVLSSPVARTYSGVISGGGNLVVTGPSALTLNGSVSNTFSGSLVVTGGTLVADFSNMAVPQQLLPQCIETNAVPSNGWALGGGSANNGTQGEGSITIVGKPGAYTTIQKFGIKSQSGTPGSTFTITGTGRILVNPNGGTETQIDIGNAYPTANSALLIGYTANPGTGNVVFTSYRGTANTIGNGNSSLGRVYFTTDGGTTVYHTQHTGGSNNGWANRDVPMEPSLGGTAYGTVTIAGASGYAKLTGAQITAAGGTFTMNTGAGFTGSGRASFYKIESPLAGQSLVMNGNNCCYYSGSPGWLLFKDISEM
ncbi:MAG: autotransporter-associated beta strand repeat-containing protein, partial [Verrucomicrobiota bacterium]